MESTKPPQERLVSTHAQPVFPLPSFPQSSPPVPSRARGSLMPASAPPPVPHSFRCALFGNRWWRVRIWGWGERKKEEELKRDGDEMERRGEEASEIGPRRRMRWDNESFWIEGERETDLRDPIGSPFKLPKWKWATVPAASHGLRSLGKHRPRFYWKRRKLQFCTDTPSQFAIPLQMHGSLSLH